MKKWFNFTAVCVILLCLVGSSWASEYSDLRKRMDFRQDEIENYKFVIHKHEVWIGFAGTPGLSMVIHERNADSVKTPLFFIYSPLMRPNGPEIADITMNIDGDMTRFSGEKSVSTSYDAGNIGRWIWVIGKNEEQTKNLADKIAKSRKTLIRIFYANNTHHDFAVTNRQKKVIGEVLRFYELVGDMPLNTPDIGASGNDKTELTDIGLKVENYIAKVSSNGLAQKCGLPDGSKILEVNGKKAEDIPNLQSYIEERIKSGKSVMIICEKDEKTEMITLKKQN